LFIPIVFFSDYCLATSNYFLANCFLARCILADCIFPVAYFVSCKLPTTAFQLLRSPELILTQKVIHILWVEAVSDSSKKAKKLKMTPKTP
jgi:hypothetical protein